MSDIHLMSGDTAWISGAPATEPVLTLWNGDRVFLTGGRGNLRARSRDDALTEGINALLYRPGRVTKRDLRDLLEAAAAAVVEVTLT